MILFQIDADAFLGYFMIPQNEIRRFGIRRNETEPHVWPKTATALYIILEGHETARTWIQSITLFGVPLSR